MPRVFAVAGPPLYAMHELRDGVNGGATNRPAVPWPLALPNFSACRQHGRTAWLTKGGACQVLPTLGGTAAAAMRGAPVHEVAAVVPPTGLPCRGRRLP